MHLKHYILFAILGFTVLFLLLPTGTEDIPVTSLKTEIIAHLPDPASNNAVAKATLGGDVYLFSFSGLGIGKTRADIHARAYAVNVTEQWARDLPSLPGGKNPLDYRARLHHTQLDTFDHIVPEDLKQASVILASFLYLAAMRDEPLPRKPLPKEPKRVSEDE